MSDDGVFEMMCPYCGEAGEIYVEADVAGQFVQDCEVCCNPLLVHVSAGEDGRGVRVVRADGGQ